MAFQVHLCDNTAKAAQVLSEHYGVPYLTVDLSNPSQTSRAAREFLVGQLMDSIDFMIEVSGKEYHDEKLIEATHNEWQTLILWSKIYDLQKAVPAPVDARMLHALLMPLTNQKEKKEVVDYYQTLYEEVQDRVKNGISARGFEDSRLMLDGIPPYYYPQIMRYPEKYGAIITSSRISFTWGAWGEDEDGVPYIPLTPRERGIELKTREDAVRSLSELYLDYVPNIRQFNFSRKVDITWRLAKGWKADGVLYHMDRGCKGVTAGGQETVKELRTHGIPAMVFEGSQADPRDFDMAQVQDAMDSFMESLDLSHRED
jgi:benzoyl-CoA reductase subunit B